MKLKLNESGYTIYPNFDDDYEELEYVEPEEIENYNEIKYALTKARKIISEKLDPNLSGYINWDDLIELIDSGIQACNNAINDIR